MVTYSGAWSPGAVAAFLDEAVVPLRLACLTPRDDLWTLSLWYRFEDGRFSCATRADADVVRFLERDDRVGFEVSTNAPPYRGVRGSGTATVERDEGKSLLRGLVERYLGDTGGELARGLLDDDREEVRIHVRPTRVYSWDFAGRMRDLDDVPAGDPPPDFDPEAAGGA